MKYLYRSLVVLVIILSLCILFFSKIKPDWEQKIASEKEIILEKLVNVQKLITVEGYFSEVYDYKDYYAYDWWPLRKKALIRVKAKASIGYNFDQFEYEIDQRLKTIVILKIPQAEILSIDHDLDYYDLSEGTFNQFTTKDYNLINKQAKNFISEQVQNSELFSFAQIKLFEYLNVIDEMANSTGWKLIFPENPS